MKLNCKAGTTVVELLVVLTILAVIAGITFSLFESTDYELVRQQAYALAEHITMMQQRAQIYNSDTYIMCDQQHNSYADETGTYQLLGAQYGAPAGCKGPPSAPLKPVTKPITFEKSCITCYAHGTVKSGTIYLCNASKTICFAVTTPVDEVTHVRVYEYRGAGWYSLS